MPHNAVDRALRAGLTTAYSTSSGGNPTEPEMVAGVFRTGLPQLDRDLQQALAPTQVRISGVFCHGRPIVNGTTGWSCELGDLLILTRETSATAPTNRALLLQVKRGAAPAQVTKPRPQADLYQYWPQFTLFGNPRHVTPASPHEGAQFSFWDTSGSVAQGCTHYQLDDLVPGLTTFSSPLQNEIVKAIHQTGGRQFDDRANLQPADQGWSRVIWDLVDRSISKAWSVAGGAQSDPSRAWNHGVFLYTADRDIPDLLRRTDLEEIARELFAAANADPPDDGPPLSPDVGDPDPEGGPSLLIIETAAQAH